MFRARRVVSPDARRDARAWTAGRPAHTSRCTSSRPHTVGLGAPTAFAVTAGDGSRRAVAAYAIATTRMVGMVALIAERSSGNAKAITQYSAVPRARLATPGQWIPPAYQYAPPVVRKRSSEY